MAYKPVLSSSLFLDSPYDLLHLELFKKEKESKGVG